MSEREFHIDVCPECKVKEEDASEKKLYQCRYCERWFCERHLGLRVVHVPNYNEAIKDPAWREIVEKNRKRNDGHPDFAYTVEKLNELKIEKQLMWGEIGAALEKSRAYRKVLPEEPIATEQLGICPKCGSTRIMTTAFRKEFETFQCLSCNHKWKESKEVDSEVRTVPIVKESEREEGLGSVRENQYRLIPVEPKPRNHRTRNAIIIVSFLAVLLIGVALSTGSMKPSILLKSPIASFASSKTTGIFTGERIVFNASSSYDPDNTKGKGIVTYRWNFGDGKPIETVTSHAVTHSYASVKRYNITLTVIDDDRQNATCSRVIEVKWEIPSVSQLRSWLASDSTNQMTYHDPDFVCHDFAEMLANHSRQKNWKTAFVMIEGYDTETRETWNHAINAINTTEGLVYIEPQTDEVWWYNNHAPMVSGNTYNFWSYPYETVSVHINDIMVLSLEDLDRYQFLP